MIDLSLARWRKSARSGSGGGNSCVEVADNLAGVVPLRDSKDPDGAVLVFTPGEWAAFTRGVRMRSSSCS